MLARARRAFPGMVVSMLLAAPALAAPAGTHTTEHPAPRVAHLSPDHRKTAQRTARAAKPARFTRSRTRPAEISPATFFTGPYPVEPGPPKYAHTDQDITNQALSGHWGTGEDWQQIGMASWYGGKRWRGHATSSGERYKENELTAAHATLPIGTRVRVTLAGSDRSVVVVINDRPGTRTRIIDLSRGAARQLGILNSGVAVVTLSLL
jgi:rare lipoprotein A